MNIPFVGPFVGDDDALVHPPPSFNPARIIREGRPEWVMLGLNWPGPGVLLIASQSLTQAELDYRARQYDFHDWSDFVRNFENALEYTLSVHMHGCTFVAGPTYAECLATLLREWDPDKGPWALGGSDT